MNISYRITGGTPLRGDVHLSGAKNAALPLLAGSLLCDGKSIFHNVPRLSDVHIMLRILSYLGAKVEHENSTVCIDTSAIENKPIPHELVSRLRGSIVLLGPLLARFGSVEMAYPGGCVLGKRPVHAHTSGLVQMGARDLSTNDTLKLEGKLQATEVILPEFSVTATENILLAASLLPGKTTIHLAAYEPHVQDVQKFLSDRGAHSKNIGPHVLSVEGQRSLSAGEHTVISDYLEAGAFIMAGLATRGDIRIHDIERDHLITVLNAVKRAGGICEFDEKGILHVDGANSVLQSVRIQTNIFPGFPTDLQAPMGVVLTQAKGVSRIFEVLFEERMAYLYELEKMGAHIEILNSHQALIIGPSALHGRIVASNDIRAGVAMVIAGLCATGETVITDVHYIERGYEKLDEKLQKLGAKIERESEPSHPSEDALEKSDDSVADFVYYPTPNDKILRAK